MNVRYTPAPPVFKKFGPPMVLKKFAYDHLNQELVLTDLPPITLNAPTLVSFEHNKALLRQWFPNLVIGDNQPQRGISSNPNGKQRTVCDFCHTEINYRQTGGCPSQADRGSPGCGDKESCLSDAMLRRPCFFQANVPLWGVHGEHEMPAPMARLFMRLPQVDYWVISSPNHMTEGVARATREEVGGGEEEQES